MATKYRTELIPNWTELKFDTPVRNKVLRESLISNKNNLLGRGSYGLVIKGKYRSQNVAVKLLAKTCPEETPKTLKNEANILGFDHPNVVKLLKVTSNHKYGIVIMEQLNGMSLQRITEEIGSAMALYCRLCIVLDICSALSYCHLKNILHLDVKPQNVMVSYGSSADRKIWCKLGDFGSSVNLKTLDTNFSSKGTIRYMAPEMLCGKVVTGKTDVYSMGITMWQLKSGRTPYESIKSNEIVAYQVVKNNLRPERHLNGVEVMADGSKDKESAFSEITVNYFDSGFDLTPITPSSISFNQYKTYQEPNSKFFIKENEAGSSFNEEFKTPILRKSYKRNLFPDTSSLNERPCKFKKLTPELTTSSIHDEIFMFLRQKHASLNESQVENSFQMLYRQCWDNEPDLRPSINALIQNLYKLLDLSRS